MSTVLTRPVRTVRQLTGRHRLGRPGLIPATALVTVVRRGFFGSWLRRGRHRWAGATRAGGNTAVAPMTNPVPARSDMDSAVQYPAAA